MTTSTVTIRTGRFSARITAADRRTNALIKRSVPAAHREFDPVADEFVIYGSKLGALVVALRSAGIDVEVSAA